MQIHFLCYAPRSGSTFLARRLADRSSELLVVPEFRAHVALLARGEEWLLSSPSGRIERLLARDVQLVEGLGLDRAVLRTAAETGGREGIAALVRCLVGAYAERRGSTAGVALLKKGTVLDLFPEVERAFPDARFLHLVRDGRAVASSLLRTEAAYAPGEVMARGVLHASRLWAGQQRRVADLRAPLADRLLEIRYEELIDDEAAVCERALSFLGCAPAERGEKRPFAVAEAERGMHPLVERGPIAERRTAWRDELPAWQGLVVELEGGALLERLGYDLYWRPMASPIDKLTATLRGHAGHVGATAAWAGRRLWRLRGDPLAIWQRGWTRAKRSRWNM